MLDHLRRCNAMRILSVESPEFAPYGRVLSGFPTEEIVAYLEQKTPIPETGNVYVASDPAMERLASVQTLSDLYYGGMPIQAGYCNGNNNRLNCLEYHKSSEIDIAADPQVLLLAHVWQLRDNCLDAGQVIAVYVPRGMAVELYGTTLHFSPCKTTDAGFRTAIVLPRGTNLPLEAPVEASDGEGRLLWMKNKWLLSCPETAQAERGAFVGIIGENYVISH